MSADGKVTVKIAHIILAYDTNARTITIKKEWAKMIRPGDIMTLTRDGAHVDLLVVKQVTDATNQCELYFDSIIPGEGELTTALSHFREYHIGKVSGQHIFIQGGKDNDAITDFIAFIQSTFFSGEGMHLIEHTLLRPRVNDIVQDALLPINLDKVFLPDGTVCENCKITDPYSCIVSVVLPFWAGRFTNTDVRRFIENTLRLEAPAHIMLNICWISCDQMAEFELAYKTWLLAIQQDSIDKTIQSAALSDFISILSRLSNVYPHGTLHGCDEGDNRVSGTSSFEGSIITNQSMLGTF
jgi:hypothetical protein